MTSTCFLICPIGSEGSETRKHSDQLLRHVIAPVLEPLGYSVVRADAMPKSGLITAQIMEAIFESDLVIADLTEKNPNVFYELALRHASRKPYVQLMRENESLPFDVAGVRTIRFDLTDPDNIETTKVTLKRQVKEIEGGHIPDSPVSRTLSESLFEGGENALPVFLEKFWDMESRFERLHQSIDSVTSDIASIESDISRIEADVSYISDKLET